MTPERYFFDVAGYLHVENAFGDEELKSAQEAADRYITMPPGEWPADTLLVVALINGTLSRIQAVARSESTRRLPWKVDPWQNASDPRPSA